MKFRGVSFFFLFLLSMSFLLTGNVLAASGWNGPSTVLGGSWYRWPSVSDDGATVVFLAPYTSSDLNQKQVQVTEFKNGSWGTPAVVASNGVDYSNESFVSLPNTKFTHPIISGNGRVIAYLGTTPNADQYNPYKYEIYIIERTDAGWGTPYVLPTGFSLHEQYMDMNFDGTVIAWVFATGSWTDDHKLYVSRKTGSTWNSPVLVSELNKGAPSQPNLSIDGGKLSWTQNLGLVYSEYDGANWSTPQWLVTWKLTDTGEDRVEYVKMSGDGSTIAYWILTVEHSIMVAHNLYAIKQGPEGWGTPVKLTATPVVPTSMYDSAPAVNSNGTKVVYSRNVQTGEVIMDSYLEITESQNGSWATPTPLTSTTEQGFDTSPVITPDGKTLVYTAGGEIRSMTSTTGSTGSFTLSVTKSGTGTGVVSAAGLTCTDSTCTGTYNADSFVILTAASDQGSVFAGWSEYCSGNSPTCTVTMDSNRHVTAAFNVPTPTYSISGRIKDLWDGKGIEGALVTIKDASGATTITTATTDASGSYNADIAAKGEYTVFASKTGYEDASPPDQPSISEITDVSPNIIVDKWLISSSASGMTSVSLAAGWNFISFPKQPSNTAIEEVLSDVSAGVTVVWGYDNQNKQWLRYKPSVSGSTLTSIQSCQGYWIYMISSGTISMSGWSVPLLNTKIYDGWNLAGYNGSDGATVENALTAISGKWVIIWGWDNGQWSAKHATISASNVPTLSTLSQAKGYWIKATGVAATGIDWTR